MRPALGNRYYIVVQMAGSEMLTTFRGKHPGIWMCFTISAVISEFEIALRTARFEDWFETHYVPPDSARPECIRQR
jgi:hypothetical protein